MLLALDITATFSEAKSATEPKRRGGRKTTIRAEIGSSGDCWAGLQMRGGGIRCPSLCSWHWRVDPAACSSNENHVLPGQEVHYWNQMCTSSGVIHFVIHPPPVRLTHSQVFSQFRLTEPRHCQRHKTNSCTYDLANTVINEGHVAYSNCTIYVFPIYSGLIWMLAWLHSQRMSSLLKTPRGVTSCDLHVLQFFFQLVWNKQHKKKCSETDRNWTTANSESIAMRSLILELSLSSCSLTYALLSFNFWYVCQFICTVNKPFKVRFMKPTLLLCTHLFFQPMGALEFGINTVWAVTNLVIELL